MVLCLAVVVFVMAVGALIAFYATKRVPVRLMGACKSSACSQYEALVIDLGNSSVAPCEDFYGHVCGAWMSQPSKLSVYDTILATYRNNLTRLALSQQVPLKGQTPEQKAAKLFTACYDVVRKDVSYVDRVRKLMKSAGLPWPQLDQRTDLLHAVFAMSSWPIPALFRVAFKKDEKSGHLIIRSIGKEIFSRLIWKKKDERQRERYFSVLKEYIEEGKIITNLTYNETVALEQRVIPVLGKSLAAGIKDYETDTNQLPKTTPSISPDRWQQELRNRFNISFAAVTINGIDFFEAFFDLHTTLGEDAMKKYVAWFVLQALLPYTNSHILREFHGTEDKAREEQMKFCLGVAGLTGYSLYANYLKTVANAQTLSQASQVGSRIKKAFHATIKRNDWFQDELIAPLEINRAEVLLHMLGKPEGHEMSWPDMSDDAFDNMARMLSFVPHIMESSTSSENAASSSVQPLAAMLLNKGSLSWDDAASHPLAIAPYHFSFPFLMEDAPAPAIYAGLGSVLARLLFQRLFSDQRQWKKATLDEARARTACIHSADKVALLDPAVRDDVVVATAASSTLWDAFLAAASPTEKAVELQPPDLAEQQLFFVLLCHNWCGSQAGAQLCNLPLKNSQAFVDTFSCPAGSPMHPAHMCPIFA
ncbi:hypothetical protein HPB48_012928 [Haemaphysalis longicornis]|uniref:Peptidase M13 N-terminal domain-containing protein n=1 Tax=Haemaphysalis longicornis TaxID=44386 RepID=A0A9J6FDY6_HAELO|nr:hypothetical protein HPB48_012928 [Haemaphysalis longicornis]